MVQSTTSTKPKEGFSQRLNKALDKEGFPPKNRGRIQRLADMMGLSHRGAGKWLEGETAPPIKKFSLLAEKLHVNTEWLISGKGNMVRDTSYNELPHPINVVDIPLYRMEDLNNPYYTPTQTVTCYASTLGKTFALKIDSEAMSPRFPAGTIIVVDTARTAKDGDFVLVHTSHFPVPQFRQFFMTHQMKFLDAHNPKFERLMLGAQDKLIGVIIEAILLFY